MGQRGARLLGKGSRDAGDKAPHCGLSSREPALVVSTQTCPAPLMSQQLTALLRHWFGSSSRLPQGPVYVVLMFIL